MNQVKPIIRLILILFVFLTLAFESFAQEKSLMKRSLNASLALGDQQGSLSFLALRNYTVAKSKNFEMGFGARFTSYIGLNQYFVTAPAQLTSGSTSPFILFRDNINGNLDSIIVKSAATHSLNAAINFGYKISKKIQLGFNIDLIGFSFGKTSTANYINGNKGNNTTASPTAFNLLLVSDNDRGSLNSEFYGSYFFNKKWGVKLAAQFLFTEYTSAVKVQTFPQENDRFRNKSLLASIGVTYKF